MPISRTPWIDDDGSGTTGTIINNAAKTALYNEIDAAFSWTTVQAELNGPDYPDYNPGIVGNTILYVSVIVTNATIYSFKPAIAAWPGQRIIVHSISAPSNNLSFYHEWASASAGCQLRCRASPSVIINGFWSYSEFQYGVFNGVGAWVMGGYGRGIGGSSP